MFGEPLPEEVAVRPQIELVNRRHNDAKERRARRKERDKVWLPFFVKLWNIAGDDEQARAVKRQRDRPRERYDMRVSEGPKVESAILLGSLELVVAPPYDYEWTAGYGGNFGDWATNSDTVSLEEISADKNSGNMHLRCKVVNYDFNDTYAGLGFFYRPVTNGFKRFRFGATWDYAWHDDSNYLTANNDAYVAMTVFETNSDGSNANAIINQKFQLWTDGTSWLEEHSDHDEALAGGFESFPFPASTAKVYQLWAWCSCQVQSDDETGGDLLPASSIAEAELLMHVPAMSVKEA